MLWLSHRSRTFPDPTQSIHPLDPTAQRRSRPESCYTSGPNHGASVPPSSSSQNAPMMPPRRPLPNPPVRELGTLVVVVLRARHLPDRHVCSKQSVYTKVTFNENTQKTSIAVRGGQRPDWDEELRFPVYCTTSDGCRVMRVSIWEDYKRGKDLLVGETIIDATKALRNGEDDAWFPLSRDGIQRGEIYMELTYFESRATTISEAISSPAKHDIRGPPVLAEVGPYTVNTASQARLPFESRSATISEAIPSSAMHDAYNSPPFSREVSQYIVDTASQASPRPTTICEANPSFATHNAYTSPLFSAEVSQYIMHIASQARASVLPGFDDPHNSMPRAFPIADAHPYSPLKRNTCAIPPRSSRSIEHPYRLSSYSCIDLPQSYATPTTPCIHV